MIKIENLSFAYSDGPAILNNVSLTIQPGESVAIMGPNGSGKTTFARCFNGLLLPVSGTVNIDHYATHIHDQLPAIRKKVGMVFQNPDNQIVSATVEREIAFGLENLGIPAEQMREIVSAMLIEFNLQDYRKHTPHYLSGGEKQRLAIAAVLAMEPQYLVLDEPTSLLDPAGRKNILQIIQGLHTRTKPITTLLITQFPEEALIMERLVVMHQGSILMDDTPQNIFTRVSELYEIGLEPPVQYAVKEILKLEMN